MEAVQFLDTRDGTVKEAKVDDWNIDSTYAVFKNEALSAASSRVYSWERYYGTDGTPPMMELNVRGEALLQIREDGSVWVDSGEGLQQVSQPNARLAEAVGWHS